VISCGQKDRQAAEEQTDLTKLIVAFENFVLKQERGPNLEDLAETTYMLANFV
jgi:hypothetical protein